MTTEQQIKDAIKQHLICLDCYKLAHICKKCEKSFKKVGMEI